MKWAPQPRLRLLASYGRPSDRSGPRPTVVAEGYDGCVRGDRVEVTVDVGSGVQKFDVTATRAGRRVEVTTGRTIIEVAEVTRGGTPVRTARFMASRVVALVEHPAERNATAPVFPGPTAL